MVMHLVEQGAAQGMLSLVCIPRMYECALGFVSPQDEMVMHLVEQGAAQGMLSLSCIRGTYECIHV